MTQQISQEGLQRLYLAIFPPDYKEPGAGAVEFAKGFTEGLSRDEAEEVIAQLLRGELHDATDNRVKRCVHCGYYWRDDSLRNTKKTCSDACNTAKKTLQRRKQRERKALLEPEKKKKRKLQDDYVYWLEYPYWGNEYSMLKVGWKFEVPHEIETIDYIEANNRIYGEGNRKVLTGDKKV